MAGDWIKMRTNLWDDPRVGRVCDLTGSKEATAIGALYWLWATADQHTEDGCMPGLSMQQIDRKTGVKGFAAALVDVGWLIDDPQGVVICHFDEHNGASAKKRSQTAKRVAAHRSGNESETPKEPVCNAPSVTPALAREEKSREEEKKDPQTPAKRGQSAVGLKAWIEAVKAAGETPIPPDDEVFAYAESVGIPAEFLRLAWLEFRHRYCQPEAKRYRNWRGVFRKAVRSNWLRLWYVDAEGAYGLTTVGLQAQRANEERKAA